MMRSSNELRAKPLAHPAASHRRRLRLARNEVVAGDNLLFIVPTQPSSSVTKGYY